MPGYLRALEEVAGVAGTEECDVAAGLDLSGASVVKQSGEALAGVDRADEDSFVPGEFTDGGGGTAILAGVTDPRGGHLPAAHGRVIAEGGWRCLSGAAGLCKTWMVAGTDQVKVGPRAVEYLPGRGMDVYAGPGDARPVLLWHGRGPDERQVLRSLAQLTAQMGLVVFVPDWRPDAADGGRAELLASVEFARSAAAEFTRSGQELVLAGWSRGGKAAAELGLAPEEAHGWRPSAVVCLASGFTRPGPITKTSPLDLAKTAAQAPPFYLVHGTADPVVPIAQARQFAAALTSAGHHVHLHECPTDHAGVILAEYDAHDGICRPTTSSHAIAAGRLSAQTLRDAAAC